MAKLNTKQRTRIPKSEFGLRGEKKYPIPKYVNPKTGDFTHVRLCGEDGKDKEFVCKLIEDYFYKSHKARKWTDIEKEEFRISVLSQFENGYMPMPIVMELTWPSSDTSFKQEVEDNVDYMKRIEWDIPPLYRIK